VWNLGLRFATSKTTITKLSNNLPITIGSFQLAKGQQLGELYGQTPLHSIGQIDNATGQPYIAAANAANYTLVNGNVVNISNNQVQLTASNDQSFMGNTNPDFTASLINRFSIYKNLQFSFQFDWKHGDKIYNQTRQWLYRDEISKDFDKPVTINGKTGAYVAYYESYYNALNPDSWFVEDGSFIRLRDVSLTYDLTSLAHTKWIRALSLTLSGRNLLTFTKYTGLDPENTAAVGSQGGGLGAVGQYTGVDYFGAPNVKSYQVALNIGF
jgi:TonB-dependent starch-binding outer membrane protein SusC